MMRFLKFSNLGTVLLIVLFVLGSSRQVLPTQASPLAGTLITVSTPEDALVVDGNCSLREAIRAANTDTAVDACPAGSGTDTISIPAGNYLLQIPGTDENNAMTGDLDITSDLQIRGAGNDLTVIDSAGLDRVFHISKSAEVSIKYLAIQKGMATGLNGGGGIFNEQGSFLTVDQCLIIGNRTTNIGGGIDNLGTLKLTNSTISGNEAKKGGGVFNGGTLTFEASTVMGNTALEIGGGLDNGGNIGYLTNITISDNKATIGGGGIFNDAVLTILHVSLSNNSTAVDNIGDMRFKNTLVANSTAGPNCTGRGTFTSEGNNLDSGASCKFTVSTDLQNSDPLLGPLYDNEGPTLTYALLEGSPAIDAGGSQDCPIFDQRGAIRPADGNNDGSRICDIGAFEQGASFPQPLFLPMVRRK